MFKMKTVNSCFCLFILTLCVNARAYDRFEMEFGKAANVGSEWKTIDFTKTFKNPIVVCSVHYRNNTKPVLTRVQNVDSRSFEVKLQNPSNAPVVPEDVMFIAVEKGLWVMPDGRNIEAFTVDTKGSCHKGDWKTNMTGSNIGTLFHHKKCGALKFAQPVTLGQVMTFNNEDWSVFVNRPAKGGGNFGAHVGQERNVNRTTETLGIITVEQGSGVFEGVPYVFGRSEPFVKGVGNSSGTKVPLGVTVPSARIAVVCEYLQNGSRHKNDEIDGPDGSWAVLFGSNPFGKDSLQVAVDEDQIGDKERDADSSRVNYAVFGQKGTSIPQNALARMIPYPVKVDVINDKPFALNASTKIAFESDNIDAQKASIYLANFIHKSTGYNIKTVAHSNDNPGKNMIFITTEKADSSLGEEGYNLKITADSVTIRASHYGGMFNGLMTLYQLLPPEIYARSIVKNIVWKAPAVRITDYPRFAWRGYMLDLARNFLDKDEQLKLIDEMSFLKINKLHMHLDDDQGFRVEILSRPKLTTVGANMPMTNKGGGPGHLTQDEVREIVAYAAERNIEVIPEIEVPGHNSAKVAAYPVMTSRADGKVCNVLNPARQETWDILDDIFREISELFPSQYVHIGGDEVNTTFWRDNPKVRKYMKTIDGVNNEHELYHWFVSKVISDLLETKYNKTAIAWDEYANAGGIPKSARTVSQLWNNGSAFQKGGLAEGKPVINSILSYLYFDHYQWTTHLNLPGEKKESRSQNGCTPLFQNYGADLGYNDKFMGGESPLWTHIIEPTVAEAEDMYFPRMCGTAELTWSRQYTKDWVAFYKSIYEGGQAARFDAFNINSRKHHVAFACWSPFNVTGDYKEIEWNVSGRVKEAALLEVCPRQHKGSRALDIDWVALYRNGMEIARDDHHGRTRTANNKGEQITAPVKNNYNLHGNIFDDGADYTIRMHVRLDGKSGDSVGTILLRTSGDPEDPPGTDISAKSE